jgi:hypothetical protein
MADNILVRALRRVARITLVLGGGVVAACNDASAPSPPGPGDPVAGDFTLSTVDAQALPFAIYDEADYKLEILQGTVTLTNSGQFTIATSTRETVAGAISMYADTTRGTYTQVEGVIGFTLQPEGTTGTGSWDGTTLTIAQVEGMVTTTYVYAKTQ